MLKLLTKLKTIKNAIHKGTFILVLRKTFANLISFSILLNMYLLHNLIIIRLIKIKIIPRKIVSKIVGFSSKVFKYTEKVLDPREPGNVCKVDLIELAIKNMTAKKVRSFITIGGVSIGFGAIVFLVSIGYGLQEVVIKRVARLDELQQADVTSQVGSKVKINDETIASIKSIQSVKKVLPLIAVVGRVNYQNSVSDMAVYGVTTSYLANSAIKPIKGKIFDSEDLVSHVTGIDSAPTVAGASTSTVSKNAEFGETINEVEFNVVQGNWIRVRDKPSTGGKILGYTRRVEGGMFGREVWGGSYDSEDGVGKSGVTATGDPLGKWIKAEYMLWEKASCRESALDCVDGSYQKVKTNPTQIGFTSEINTIISSSIIPVTQNPSVLGDTTTATETSQSTGSAVSVGGSTQAITINETGEKGWVDIPELSGAVKAPETQKVALSPSSVKQAVVNRAMLKVLGIDENDAVGKTFTASFIVTSNLIPDAKGKVESLDEIYTIVGVTPDEDSPYFYVPFIDLRSMGISNYSQLKIVSENTTVLEKVRKQVEGMGLNTQSVADTVDQINSLFGNIRVVLGIMGMIALSVAALGMFNTFTISLLERTREVGLMKAMGMRSDEVQELFLTESMIMGFWGGILGLVIGFIGGKLLGVAISIFAVFKGVGFIDVSYIPTSFVMLILFLSLIVGIGTGIYPAVRARKISALNALRYE